MSQSFSRIIVLVLSIFLAASCSNKKLENNVKSLEKRVAQLEKKSGIAPVSGENTNSTGESDELPVLAFQAIEYDFGTVKEGDVVDHIFQFTNTGNFPLIISKATATCGCTVPEWPKDPIGPGESGEIKVKFNTLNRTNQQTKYVNISANTKPEITRLKISGNVLPGDNSNS